jgi:hypothetical protein
MDGVPLNDNRPFTDFDSPFPKLPDSTPAVDGQTRYPEFTEVQRSTVVYSALGRLVPLNVEPLLRPQVVTL